MNPEEILEGNVFLAKNLVPNWEDLKKPDYNGSLGTKNLWYAACLCAEDYDGIRIHEHYDKLFKVIDHIEKRWNVRFNLENCLKGSYVMKFEQYTDLNIFVIDEDYDKKLCIFKTLIKFLKSKDIFERKWIKATEELSEYPVGTKAKNILGGHWIKNERGWKWQTGSTFPRPGGDWDGTIQLPI